MSSYSLKPFSQPGRRGQELSLPDLKQAILHHADTPDFGLAELAESVGMSTTHLKRKVRVLAETSPGALIRTVRLEHACELLLNSNASVKQVAYACGYRQPSVFGAAFRAQYECTPSEYRALHTATTSLPVLQWNNPPSERMIDGLLKLAQAKPWVAQCLCHMCAHLDDPSWGTAELARALHMSLAQLHRRHKQLVEISPGKLLRWLRLGYAAHVLQHRSDSIMGLAYELGYSDPAQFSRAFAAVFDCSPNQFRQRYESQKGPCVIEKLRNGLNPILDDTNGQQNGSWTR